MRDLAKDSRWLQRQEPNRDNHISVNFYRAYDWLNQAIRAEAEVERLQKVYAITNESWKKQVEELTLLRKVAEAGEKAIKTLDNTCYLFAKADDRAIHNEAVKMFWQALAELDGKDINVPSKEGER